MTDQPWAYTYTWARTRVPATSANLGPGYDSLGMALDLWNEAEFRLEGDRLAIELEGESVNSIPRDETNAIYTAFQTFAASHGVGVPAGLAIHCRNQVPSSSGLGSSATAQLMGLLGANVLLGSPATRAEILTLAADLEGHADNAAAALYGGLVVSFRDEQGWVVRRHALPALDVLVALPCFDLPTPVSRQALPVKVSREDAIFNLSRTPVVVEALQSGDLDLLARAMQDRLHQPVRAALIPGLADAMSAARAAGAKAVALSGAGPSLIAFCEGDGQAASAAAAVCEAFSRAGLESRCFALHPANQGAQAESPAGLLP